ncbi:hypothetical protein pb186bvf_019216 [Paramecium bursaria]
MVICGMASRKWINSLNFEKYQINKKSYSLKIQKIVMILAITALVPFSAYINTRRKTYHTCLKTSNLSRVNSENEQILRVKFTKITMPLLKLKIKRKDKKYKEDPIFLIFPIQQMKNLLEFISTKLYLMMLNQKKLQHKVQTSSTDWRVHLKTKVNANHVGLFPQHKFLKDFMQ